MYASTTPLTIEAASSGRVDSVEHHDQIALAIRHRRYRALEEPHRVGHAVQAGCLKHFRQLQGAAQDRRRMDHLALRVQITGGFRIGGNRIGQRVGHFVLEIQRRVALKDRRGSGQVQVGDRQRKDHAGEDDPSAAPDDAQNLQRRPVRGRLVAIG